MEKQLNRRKLKSYLIVKDFQLKLIAINFIHMILVVLITIAALMVPVYVLLMQSANLENQYHAALFFIAITDQLPVALVLVLLLFIAHQVIITHQFCGPIVNFSNTFKNIANGDLTRRVHLRKYDHLQNEADCINSMIDGLSERIGSIRQENEDLLLSLQDICVSPAGADEQQKSNNALQAALRHAQEVKCCLDAFRLADSSPEKH